MSGEIFLIRDVAEWLKVTEGTIYRLAAANKIPAFKVWGLEVFKSRHRRMDKAAVRDRRSKTGKNMRSEFL